MKNTNKRKSETSGLAAAGGINTDITVKNFPLSDLNPAVYNPRKISAANLADLRCSLVKFGLVEPIVVNIRDGRNVIVGGHQRFKVLASEGVTDAVCVTVDLSDADERTLNVTLNNPAIAGDFIDGLNAYLDSLEKMIGEGADIRNLRIDQLRTEIAGENKTGLADDDQIPTER